MEHKVDDQVVEQQLHEQVVEQQRDGLVVEQQPKNRKREALIAVVVLVVVVALALAAYSALRQKPPIDGPDEMPPYSLAASDADDAARQATLACQVTGLEGADVTLADIAADGKPLVVNVWATWCPYCVAEMQDFQELCNQYGDQVHFVMLNACDTAREVTLGREYIADNGFTFPVYFDINHEVMGLFGINALPTTIVISPQGDVLMSRAGQIELVSMRATLNELLKA